MRRQALRAGLLAVWLGAASLVASLGVVKQAAAQTAAPRNVIVVILDGVRYSETFGDPTHANIPLIWGSMRPQSAIYTSFYNRGQTVTAGGHGSLLSGTDEWLDQGSVAPPYPEWAMPRTYAPTLFEYYRAATGAPQSSAWLIANHVKFLQGCAYSVHPDYGANYAATWLLGKASDAKMMRQAFSIMDQYHPNLMLIDLHQTDKVAHADDYLAYLSHIRTDDMLVYALWRKIRRHPFYRGRTVLIVTNDHGRHTTDFTDHGDCCEGCQHLMFLAFGPNIRRGFVGTTERHIDDLGPTIAALLGIPAPYTVDGSVMEEMFYSPDALTIPEVVSPVSSLVLQATAVDRNGNPKTTVAPGEILRIQVTATNTGALPATVYQCTTTWVGCRAGSGGVALGADPLQVTAGGSATSDSPFQIPAAMPAGAMPITLHARGLDQNGQIVEGTTVLELTVQP